MEESRGTQLPGQRFCPMDDELVLFYLKPMLSGENVPGRNRLVFDCDLYGKQEPWEIWEDFKTRRPQDLRLNKDIYFFTQHKTISSTDKRIRRNVGSGTWRSDDFGKPVVSVETGRVVGLKKRLTYKNVDSVQNGCWILYEFFLDRSLRDKKRKLKDYVLCLLRKNGEPKTKIAKKRKQREEEDEVLENNDACDDTEISRGEQEELLEAQAKKQRTAPSIDSAPPTMPSQDDDAFAAELQETLECVEDNYAPLLEAEASSFRGDEENFGQQPLAANHGIFNQLQEKDRFEEFLDRLSTEEMEEMAEILFYGMSSNIDVAEQNVVNSSTLHDAPVSSMSAAYDYGTAIPCLSSENGCIDTSGCNDVGGGVMGYEDGVCMPEPLVEVAADEQQKTPDDDLSDLLGSIDFSPEANNFFCSEPQLCS
uniref:uncharacterized protein LOC105351744 n=1 Tax=Fragaria vesca subsp. vesca TaxID=101020 RepID=UPI0005C996BE|nr:PREDICTED: uncharacterized protein LOC105351744 [Fragaria vesca subsp. vesca]